MGKIITKTVERDLMCRLTEVELEEEGRKLTDFLLEKATLEVEKSASNKHYADRIKAVDVRIEKQIPVVRDREIERKVACLVEYNVPEKGLKRVTRLDTNEVVETSEMTSDECQDLFLNAPEAETAPEAPAVKALPAPADENVIDAEEIVETPKAKTTKARNIIRVGCYAYAHPIAGRIYEIEGELYRAIKSTTQADCMLCAFHDYPKKKRADFCSHFNCDQGKKYHFLPYEEDSETEVVR